MITTEASSEILEMGFDTLIPFTMLENAETGEIDYIVYSEFEGFAKEFESKFKGCEFSEAALDSVWNVCFPFADNLGYAPERKKFRTHYKRYVFDDRCDISSLDALVCDGTLIISEEEAQDYKNLTTYDFGESEDTAVTIADGKIVSLCSINSFSENGYLELSVETAPDYRGCGYASSCLALMTRELMLDGECAEYRCSHKNIASAMTAERCGYRYTGRIYYFVCYKKELINGI